MIRKISLLLLAVVLVLSACNMPIAAGTAPQIWIDDPLDGMRLPLQPYTFTLHSSDPQGISMTEVRINGDVHTTLTNPDPAQLLVYQTLEWEPAVPGRYVIRARAQNTAGVWSAEDLVTVEVERPSTPTHTPTATPTIPTITPTILTITPTATDTLTPVPDVQIGFTGPPVFSLEQINLPYDCPSSSLTAGIKVVPSKEIKSVMLFFRLTDKDFAEQSEWANIGMRPDGAGTYRVTFNPIRDGEFMPWLTSHWSPTWKGWLSTQFVIQKTNGDLIRSEVYRLVKIEGCR